MTSSPIVAFPASRPFPHAAASPDRSLSTEHPIAPGQHPSPAHALNAARRVKRAIV
jgi:hypothetical protein